MAWQTPKTDWQSNNVVTKDDMNRIEGNIQELQDTKETPTGAQAKADEAEQNAKNYAESVASQAETNAKNYANTIVGAVEDDLESHKNESATLEKVGHVKYGVLTVTLDTEWSGTSAPYTKTVSASGLISTDTPIIDVIMSGTYSTDEARMEAWGYIYRAVTANGSITFYATEKPTVALPIQIKVVR